MLFDHKLSKQNTFKRVNHEFITRNKLIDTSVKEFNYLEKFLKVRHNILHNGLVVDKFEDKILIVKFLKEMGCDILNETYIIKGNKFIKEFIKVSEWYLESIIINSIKKKET